MTTMVDELSRRGQKRVRAIKEAYISGEIDEEMFDTLLDAALDDGPPFRKKWFKTWPEVMPKRYTDDMVYLYKGDEYLVEGEYVVRAENKEIDRTIDVTAEQ